MYELFDIIHFDLIKTSTSCWSNRWIYSSKNTEDYKLKLIAYAICLSKTPNKQINCAASPHIISTKTITFADLFGCVFDQLILYFCWWEESSPS